MEQEIDLISQSALLPHRQTILAGGTLAEYVPVDVILAAPKIDAIEVVRCRNCRNSTPRDMSTRKCKIWSAEVAADGYCSYGKPHSIRRW